MLITIYSLCLQTMKNNQGMQRVTFHPSLAFYGRRGAGKEDTDNKTTPYDQAHPDMMFKIIIYKQEEQIAHVITPTHPVFLIMTHLWKEDRWNMKNARA